MALPSLSPSTIPAFAGTVPLPIATRQGGRSLPRHRGSRIKSGMTMVWKRPMADIADPPPPGEGDHPKGGGGAQAVYVAPDKSTPSTATVRRCTIAPARQTYGPPPRAGEDRHRPLPTPKPPPITP
ncbi:protein trank1 [Sphingopyxis sp. EG6]|nr:protein trank1 [Sphingopyxis sp. EG6]